MVVFTVMVRKPQLMPGAIAERVMQRLPRGAVVWVEFWNGEEQKAGRLTCAMKCSDGTLVDEEMLLYDDFRKDMTPDAEGDCWRFWSAMPTEEQRKETPWPEYLEWMDQDPSGIL